MPALSKLPLVDPTMPNVPVWLRLIQEKWPSFRLLQARARIDALMEVQSEYEQLELRTAAKATVAALTIGIKAVRPNLQQRMIEAKVENSCWTQAAHGPSFWPWAMAGSNSVFPRPFGSFTRYDHLNSVLKSGDLVRLDVGCEWDHYQGDLGRTVPVSGRYTGAT
jgi:Xaa-Pro aminopeptidase